MFLPFSNGLLSLLTHHATHSASLSVSQRRHWYGSKFRQLAEAVARATRFEGEILWDTSRPDGTPKKQLDVSRLASMGWLARIPLAEGLESTVASFHQQLIQKNVRL